MNSDELKKSLRREIIAKRKEIPDDLYKLWSNEICEKIISLKAYQESNQLLAYYAVRKEVDLSKLIEHALASEKKVYLPKCMPESKLLFLRYTGPQDVAAGKFQIMEPVTQEKANLSTREESTFLVEPGVAFDKGKNRLGYGGGYYDRFMAKHTGLTSVAAAFDLQIMEEVPVGQYDVPCKYVITEKDMY